MQPGEGCVAVRLVLAVAEATGVIELVLPVVGIGIVRNLIVVGPQLAHQTKLVRGVVIVKQRGEPPYPFSASWTGCEIEGCKP